VVFESEANNFLWTDINGHKDVFLRDWQTESTILISAPYAGLQANNGSSNAVISGNGAFVTFVSEAANLVAGDSNGVADTFVRDLQTSTTERVSIASDGTEANGPSLSSCISSNGVFVAFASAADNLVSGDTNGEQDIFLRGKSAFGFLPLVLK
jgi:Tol biopolymer transport system component